MNQSEPERGVERGLRKSTLTKTCCAKVGRGAFQQYTQNLHIHQHTHKNTHTQTHTHTQIHTSTPQHTHTQEPTQHTDFESEKHSSAHRCWGPAHECSRPPPPQPTQSQRGARQQQALGPVCHTVEAQNSQPRWLCLQGKCPCLPQVAQKDERRTCPKPCLPKDEAQRKAFYKSQRDKSTAHGEMPSLHHPLQTQCQRGAEQQQARVFSAMFATSES